MNFSFDKAILNLDYFFSQLKTEWRKHRFLAFVLLSSFFVFYLFWIYLITARNIPVYDDYVSLLKHSNRLFFQRVQSLFSIDVNHFTVYTKLWLEVFRMIDEPINFRHLILKGIAGIVGLWLILMAIWQKRSLKPHIFLFITILLFTPYYWMLFHYATAAIESVWVILWACLSFCSLVFMPARMQWFAAITFALLAAFTRADGVMVWPVLIIRLLMRIKVQCNNGISVSKSSVFLVVFLMSVFLCSIGVLMYINSADLAINTSNMSSLSTFSNNSLRIFSFSIQSLGSILKFNNTLSLIVGIIIISSYFITYKTSIARDYCLLHSILSFVILSSFTIGFGRADSLYSDPHSPQYMLNSIMATICCAAILSSEFRMPKRLDNIFNILIFSVLILNFSYWHNQMLIGSEHTMKQTSKKLKLLLSDKKDLNSKPSKDFKLKRKILWKSIKTGVYMPPDYIKNQISKYYDDHCFPVQH